MKRKAQATLNEDSGATSGIRKQVFEVIVRQAMAGAPWLLNSPQSI
ncbi:MAG: hypothetical protein WC028_28170 [Candidatus Obscuribacterales bacterium]